MYVIVSFFPPLPFPPLSSPPLAPLKVALGRLQSVMLTVHIPAIKSTRKIKVSLDETIGELIRLVVCGGGRGGSVHV